MDDKVTIADLECVINWLEHGCEVSKAVDELRLFRDKIISQAQEAPKAESQCAEELAEKLFGNKEPEINVDKDLLPQYVKLIESAFAAQRQAGREEAKGKIAELAMAYNAESERRFMVEQEAIELAKRYAAVVDALEALREAVKAEPAMNNMKYDQLGVQVNKALDEARK
jgi:hypothetical protein